LTSKTIRAFNAAGHFVWRNNQVHVPGRRFIGGRGVADIIGISKTGQFLAVEIKIPPDKMSKEQDKFHDEIRQRGGCSIVFQKESDIYNILRRW